MASLKDLKDRISSVKATQKITKAMQRVAASKFRKAQEAAEAARPYSQRMAQLIDNLVKDVPTSQLPLFLQAKNDANTYLLVICTAQRGLCGGFNSHIVRLARAKIKLLLAENKQVKIITVGKKGKDMLQREYGALMIDHISLCEGNKLNYGYAQEIGQNILNRFANEEFDICLVASSEFKTVIKQEPRIDPLIPFSLETTAQEATKNLFSYEPNVEIILDDLAKHNISVQLYNILLENLAGEMGAKMAAMDNASRNAGEMIDKLSIAYNRQRQAKITTELIEIIAGAEAL